MSSTLGTLSQNLTIPLSDVVRARVSQSPVAMPVRGGVYARLNHISAVPARGNDAGYAFSRLQAIDSMITRIARMQEQLTPDVAMDPVEQKEALLEAAAERISDGLEAAGAASGVEGWLVNMLV